MTLTIDISPDEETVLCAKAKAEGLSIEQWVRQASARPTGNRK
jgi:hypothetical protein